MRKLCGIQFSLLTKHIKFWTLGHNIYRHNICTDTSGPPIKLQFILRAHRQIRERIDKCGH